VVREGKGGKAGFWTSCDVDRERGHDGDGKG